MSTEAIIAVVILVQLVAPLLHMVLSAGGSSRGRRSRR